jgi:hypothetical protein
MNGNLTDSGKETAGGSSARRGDWVQVHRTVLEPKDRSPRLPEETMRVPLEMWVNGFLLNERAEHEEEVEIETAIGRRERGTLRQVNPGYSHSFGTTVPELLRAGMQLRGIMREIDNE